MDTNNHAKKWFGGVYKVLKVIGGQNNQVGPAVSRIIPKSMGIVDTPIWLNEYFASHLGTIPMMMQFCML